MKKMKFMLGACMVLGATQATANNLNFEVPNDIKQAIANAKVINPNLTSGFKITACANAKNDYETDNYQWICYILNTDKSKEHFTLATSSLKGDDKVYKSTIDIATSEYSVAVNLKYITDIKVLSGISLPDYIYNKSVNIVTDDSLLKPQLLGFNSYVQVEKL